MATSSAPQKMLRALLAPGATLVVVALLAMAGALGSLDRAWFDFLQRQFASRAPVPADTAIVLIDEQSLQAMGKDPFNFRWPWPRGAFAALFAELHRAGAKAIVGDFIFFETSAAEQDALLGAVAAGLPEVTLGSVPGKLGQADQLPVFWPPEFRREHAAFFAGWPRWGSVESAPDADGVIRRYAVNGSLIAASLGREPAAAASPPALLRWRGNLKQLRARGVAVLPAAPFAAAGWSLLEKAAEKSPDLDPAGLVKAIGEEPLPSGEIFGKVRGRTVFVGVNAAGTFDAKATPCGASEPGVIVHWTTYANLVAGDFLREVRPWALGVALLVLVAAIAVIDRGGLGVTKPGLLAGGGAVLALGGSAAAFLGGWWIAPALPVAGAAIGFTAVAVERFRLERARKREIQGWFGSYVSPAVVKQLLHNPDSLKLGGERRELTVYFSDLANFTTLSEKLPAERLVPLVNSVLEDLTEGVLLHGCYLDKYIGDAIMAVFGSPEPIENHALAACRAALDSLRRLAVLNERIEREYGLRLGMRIGINTGDMVVGNVGSEKKRNYTVLGDAVNLASRLEGANKEFGTSILIGPLTAKAVAGLLVTRPVAHLRVKGKAQAVEVHEPIGEPDSLEAPARQFFASYTEGFAAFSTRRFAEAAQAMAAAAALRPGDFLATRYLAEAQRLLAQPPPADWEPVLELHTK